MATMDPDPSDPRTMPPHKPTIGDIVAVAGLDHSKGTTQLGVVLLHSARGGFTLVYFPDWSYGHNATDPSDSDYEETRALHLHGNHSRWIMLNTELVTQRATPRVDDTVLAIGSDIRYDKRIIGCVGRVVTTDLTNGCTVQWESHPDQLMGRSEMMYRDLVALPMPRWRIWYNRVRFVSTPSTPKVELGDLISTIIAKKRYYGVVIETNRHNSALVYLPEFRDGHDPDYYDWQLRGLHCANIWHDELTVEHKCLDPKVSDRVIMIGNDYKLDRKNHKGMIGTVKSTSSGGSIVLWDEACLISGDLFATTVCSKDLVLLPVEKTYRENTCQSLTRAMIEGEYQFKALRAADREKADLTNSILKDLERSTRAITGTSHSTMGDIYPQDWMSTSYFDDVARRATETLDETTRAVLSAGSARCFASTPHSLYDQEYPGSSSKSSSKKRSFMSRLSDIPKRIKKLLSKSEQALYQMDWVDEDLDPTEAGVEELCEMLFEENRAKLGARAIAQVAEIEKAEADAKAK